LEGRAEVAVEEVERAVEGTSEVLRREVAATK
jgi:hypothetical protein